MADDFYGDDEAGEDLQQEWKARESQFKTLGYRDGVTAGKDQTLQQGFNAGFTESIQAGYDWGRARGITSALLTLGSRANLLLSSAAQTELAQVGPEIAAVSTADALRILSAAALDHGASRGGEGNAQEPVAKVHGSGTLSSIGPVVGAGAIDSLNAPEDSVRLQQNQSRGQSSELASSIVQNSNERSDAGGRNQEQGLEALELRVQSFLFRSNT